MILTFLRKLGLRKIKRGIGSSQHQLHRLADAGLTLIDLEPRLNEYGPNDRTEISARLNERLISPPLYGARIDMERCRELSDHYFRTAHSVDKFLNLVSQVGKVTKTIGDGQSRYLQLDEPLVAMVDDFYMEGLLWDRTAAGDWSNAYSDLRPLAIRWRVIIQHALPMFNALEKQPGFFSFTTGLFNARDQLIKLAHDRAKLLSALGQQRH